MRLCMFTPKELALERGWPGRIDGDRVIQLAAQTLQAYFSGGGRAREHATFMLDEVRLLAPVLHPPSIRVFDLPSRFLFANPAAIVGPEASISAPEGAAQLHFEPRLAAVMGAEGAIGGFTLMNVWVAPDLEPPKDRDIAASLGPAVVTADELDGGHLEVIATLNQDDRREGRLPDFDWEEAVAYAARNTVLRPGDLIAGPAASFDGSRSVSPGDVVAFDVEPIGALKTRVT
jgi:2-keto-4-pentenoate hydratase/2-oxohepta-3-ene-1,7-dioic acid hydratase in catechol pathway